jgi:type IV pilus assembly protein PilO
MNLRDQQVQKRLMLGLLPVLAAVLYYQFVHSPRAEEADQLEMRVETLESQNNALRAVVARYGDDLERRLAIFQEHVGHLEQLIPSREDVPVLINMISARAYDHGVELLRLQPGGENPGQFYSHQTFQLQVSGDFHSIAEYLTAIGSLPRIVRSSRVTMRPVAGAPAAPGSSPVLEAGFVIETYVMPTEQEGDGPNANG